MTALSTSMRLALVQVLATAVLSHHVATRINSNGLSGFECALFAAMAVVPVLVSWFGDWQAASDPKAIQALNVIMTVAVVIYVLALVMVLTSPEPLAALLMVFVAAGEAVVFAGLLAIIMFRRGLRRPPV